MTLQTASSPFASTLKRSKAVVPNADHVPLRAREERVDVQWALSSRHRSVITTLETPDYLLETPRESRANGSSHQASTLCGRGRCTVSRQRRRTRSLTVMTHRREGYHCQQGCIGSRHTSRARQNDAH